MTSNEAELHQLEEAWADAPADWAVPERYLAQVSTSPFELSPSSFRPDTARLRTPTLSWLAEELAREMPRGNEAGDVTCATTGDPELFRRRIASELPQLALAARTCALRHGDHGSLFVDEACRG